jgi:ATP-dependent DNA helicase RecQ
MATTTAKKPAGKKIEKLPEQIPVKKLDLHKALQEFFGFDKFKGSQEKIIESVLAGHDTFVVMPTGGGKSLCYQLPALVSDGLAIIVSPLIALMKNQVDLVRVIAVRMM